MKMGKYKPLPTPSRQHEDIDPNLLQESAQSIHWKTDHVVEITLDTFNKSTT